MLNIKDCPWKICKKEEKGETEKIKRRHVYIAFVKIMQITLCDLHNSK